MNHPLLPILGAAIAAASLGLAQSAQAETLRFGTDPTYPPYEYKLPSGQLAGLDIDIGNALCATAHVKCEWVEGSFDGKGFELAGPQIVDPSLLSASSVIGVRKDDAHTLQVLDTALAQLKQDGTIDRLTHKYLDAKTTAK